MTGNIKWSLSRTHTTWLRQEKGMSKKIITEEGGIIKEQEVIKANVSSKSKDLYIPIFQESSEQDLQDTKSIYRKEVEQLLYNMTIKGNQNPVKPYPFQNMKFLPSLLPVDCLSLLKLPLPRVSTVTAV
jgi:hypothetical protein